MQQRDFCAVKARKERLFDSSKLQFEIFGIECAHDEFHVFDFAFYFRMEDIGIGLQRTNDIAFERNCGFRCGRRSRGSKIGCVIGKRPIDFVSDGGNHRYVRFVDGAYYRFVAEGKQIFEGAASAADDKHVAKPEIICDFYLPHDRFRRSFSLHRCR